MPSGVVHRCRSRPAAQCHAGRKAGTIAPPRGSRFGVPGSQVEVLGHDLLAAAKGLAALDPTVPSAIALLR